MDNLPASVCYKFSCRPGHGVCDFVCKLRAFTESTQLQRGSEVDNAVSRIDKLRPGNSGVRLRVYWLPDLERANKLPSGCVTRVVPLIDKHFPAAKNKAGEIILPTAAVHG